MQVKTIVRDFAGEGSNSVEFYAQLATEVIDLDIGLLIVNAGVSNWGELASLSGNEL